ncbi:MAG: MOSC domain-containing protein [Pseudohongiellaceae bacterium]|nr:MOSC domain-containing protein [Pseudohongiellaceae bacterium]
MAIVEKIYLATSSQTAPSAVQSAELVAYAGIKGDRYYQPQQALEGYEPTLRKEDVTLISAEQIERFNEITGLRLAYGDFRRNILTRGIDLNAYIGKELRIGDCVLYGVELCEPCRSLAKALTPLVFPHLVHKGGLRCAVIKSGTIRAGQEIVSAP